MKTVNWGKGVSAPSAEKMQRLHVGMETVLRHRLQKGIPLIVNRPLVYPTSVMDTMHDEDNDGFYQVRKSQSLGKFIDINMTIPVGSELILQQVDNGMQEFIFLEKSSNIEHSISFAQKDLLKSQTDIYEVVTQFLQEN